MSHPPRIALIACSQSKLKNAALAGELYTGALFRKSRAYAEATCERWYILSAEYHLVEPEQLLAPYNTTLVGAPPAILRAWGRKVASELVRKVPEGASLVLLAGRAYRAALPASLWERYTREEPLAGCRGNGQQMQRLDLLRALARGDAT